MIMELEEKVAFLEQLLSRALVVNLHAQFLHIVCTRALSCFALLSTLKVP